MQNIKGYSTKIKEDNSILTSYLYVSILEFTLFLFLK